MKKKLLSLTLALVLILGLAVPAAAAEISDTAGVNLTAGERKIYNEVEKAVLDIVAGRRTGTEVSVSFTSGELGWTAGELGLISIGNADGGDYINIKLNESFEKIYYCLKYNYPFDMFFALHGAWSWSYRWQNGGDRAWITQMTCTLKVTPEYQGSSDSTVDPYKIAQTVSVKNNAMAIVQANEGKSNYDKLLAYRQAICDLTDYNYDIYELWKTETYVYGNPSQAVYVFDRDPNTKVLCEGYSKAFKYLCDLSTFAGDVHCYLVEGDLNGEGHMWNVVRMEDGNYYLTDITVYDTGGFGNNVPLLASSSEDPADYNYQQALYTYNDVQYGLFTNGYLQISSTRYEPGHAAAAPTPTPTPTGKVSGFDDVRADDYFAEPVVWAVENGITYGTSANTFSPEAVCNRAQILTFLWRASGCPEPVTENPFIDISADDYFYKAALWAAENGMVSGYTFDAAVPCTRASTVEYMWKAAGSPEAYYSGRFEDIPASAEYAQAVAWALDNSITSGTGETTFSPASTCTRGQIATFLYRFLG